MKIVGQVVSVDDDVVQGGLLAFGDADLDVDRIVLDVRLDRGDAEEEIAVVAVELGDVHLVLLAAAVKALLHRDHVIDIPLADAQHLVERIGGINGVPGPGDVAEIIPVPFLELQVDAQLARLHIIDGIADEPRVAVTGFVEGAQRPLLVGQVFLFVELLAVEEIVVLVGFGLLHRTGELILLDMVVADEVDFLDADLFPPVDVEVDPDGVLDHGVALHLSPDAAVQEALFRVVALDDVGGCLLHVFGELAATPEVQPLLDILALARLHAAVGPAGHARTLLDADAEPRGIAVCAQAVDLDGHVLEITLQIQAAHHVGDVVAGHGHAHPGMHPGLVDDLLLAEHHVPLDGNPCDDVFLRMVVVHFHPAFLGPGDKGRQKQGQKGQDPSYSHIHSIKCANIPFYLIFPKRRSRDAYSSSACL